MVEKEKAVIGPITKRTEFNAAGQAMEVYEINFTSPSGVRDRIAIAEADYTPETVKRIIGEKVKIHESIMGG